MYVPMTFPLLEGKNLCNNESKIMTNMVQLQLFFTINLIPIVNQPITVKFTVITNK